MRGRQFFMCCCQFGIILGQPLLRPDSFRDIHGCPDQQCHLTGTVEYRNDAVAEINFADIMLKYNRLTVDCLANCRHDFRVVPIQVKHRMPDRFSRFHSQPVKCQPFTQHKRPLGIKSVKNERRIRDKGSQQSISLALLAQLPHNKDNRYNNKQADAAGKQQVDIAPLQKWRHCFVRPTYLNHHRVLGAGAIADP